VGITKPPSVSGLQFQKCDSQKLKNVFRYITMVLKQSKTQS
jgi:hypothetical protein